MSSKITRRAVLARAATIGAAAGVATGIVAGGNAAASILTEASPLASRDELLARYNSWLFYEHRYLALEMYPGLGLDAERYIPCDRYVSMFHHPMRGEHPQFARQVPEEAPPPSTRAALILSTLGIHTGPDPEEDEDGLSVLFEDAYARQGGAS